MNYFDRLMYAYYRPLNNAWRAKLRAASLQAITWLSQIDPQSRKDQQTVDNIMNIAAVELGPKFAAAVSSETFAYTERSLRIGIQDVAVQLKTKISIGLYGVKDQNLANIIARQNIFWIENHFDADIAEDFRSVLNRFFSEGWTMRDLATALEKQFADLGQKSAHYWQGLAEHTALRIREFGRLSGYEKAGINYYRLVNPLDDRTSDICLALVSQNQVYPLAPALDIRDKLLDIDQGAESLESARDRIKAIAPWVSPKQIEYDAEGNPTGVSGPHTPFPPFHWKCRTKTELVLDSEIQS
ncbi:MAG: hypothetical protein PHC50_03390 [Candidatus Cloacimonetes bacterium]|nr:hypothetical protein [Candidatus Cloacimonadota bacterium]